VLAPTHSFHTSEALLRLKNPNATVRNEGVPIVIWSPQMLTMRGRTARADTLRAQDRPVTSAIAARSFRRLVLHRWDLTYR